MNKIFNFLFFTAFYFGSIFSSDIEFEADKTSFDTNNELLLLEGNVSLKIENLLFKADQVSLDNKNKVFSSEKISFSSLDDFIYGQTKFVSISENETIMKDVEFSSCPCEDKIWWVESKELKFSNSDNILSTKKSKLIVQGTTLAYLNNANFPISAKRKSGILLPEISINERSGLDVKIPVYLNLRENLDLTLEPRLMTQRGYGITNQLRYLDKNYNGYFNSSFLNDDESTFKILETDDLRWSYNLAHQQKVGSSLFFNLNTSSSGDPFYLSDLGSFMSGLSRTYVLPQRAEITYFKNNLFVRADINSFKLTNPLSANQFQRIPGIEIKYFFNKKNISFNLDSDLGYFRKGGSFRNDERESLKKLSLNPSISYSFSKKNYSLKTNFLIDYLLLKHNENKKSKVLSSINIKQSLKFYNSKMLLKPYLDFYISDQKKIINDLILDSGLRMSSLNQSPVFGDLFLSGQRDINLGTKFRRNYNGAVLNINLEKLYSIGKKKIFIENYRLDFPDPFSIKINYRKNSKINFASEFSIDKNNNFSSYKNSLKINSGLFKLTFDHYLVRNVNVFNLNKNLNEVRKINSFDISSSFNLSKNWSGGFKFINDLEEKKNINSVLSLDYENDGLKIGLAYLKSIEVDWVSILENRVFKDYHKDRFRLFFELKGLGSLGRPKEDYIKRRSL
ncbi:hypothetical protein OA262_01350 [Gammaproteobacteria bacterium]|nr:hypothetical protein [Gammaproteobacteria bacterium]